MNQDARPTNSLNVAVAVKEELAATSVVTESDMEIDIIETSVVDDVSHAMRDLATNVADAVIDGVPAAVKVEDGKENEDGEGEEDDDDEDADMDDGSDSDYDFDKDLAKFDEEDDNDELDEDERYHYFKSLEEEIEDQSKEEEQRDVYVRNMLAKRHLMSSEEAEWVDKFIKEQEEWKAANKKSVDDYENIKKLAKFIPKDLQPKRPVRATRK
uniref:Uncharacterized protein n=1 Tax=Globisporangium ultimum (strain ATCC 200006 / CBS 805.95 / DAOM BR144) TaxID=431595 RepID=K3WCG7_GLOUD